MDVYASAVRGLFGLEADSAKQAKYLDFIDMYARLTDDEQRRYRRRYPEEADIVTGFLQRARAEGERAVLAPQLRRRFGPLPPEAAERLRRAPEADLEAWADNVLDAGSLDEVFGTTR